MFNVGGALASYAEIDNQKIIIDLGKSSDFSPVNDFLIPLSETGKFKKGQGAAEDQYLIDQLFLSHLDKDHISDYENFKKKFFCDWMTCPNDNDRENKNNEKQDDVFKVNPKLLGPDYAIRKLVLEDMRTRQPLSSNTPLGSKSENIKLYFIKPKKCEQDDILKSGYANNISLVLFIELNEKSILMPGDLLKEGIEYLIDNNVNFKNDLNNIGVDFLVVPHHGLTTSFSEKLFQEMKNGKTRLNIISEKSRSENSDENRSEVDKRYYNSDYSTGDNSLKQNGVKTSMGHIIIDLESPEKEIKQYIDIQDVIKEFI